MEAESYSGYFYFLGTDTNGTQPLQKAALILSLTQQACNRDMQIAR
jgi:hypothetical protein